MSNRELAIKIFNDNKCRIKKILEIEKILFDDEFDCSLVRPVCREMTYVINDLLCFENTSLISVEWDINGEYRSIYFLRNEFDFETVKKLAEKHYR